MTFSSLWNYSNASLNTDKAELIKNSKVNSVQLCKLFILYNDYLKCTTHWRFGSCRMSEGKSANHPGYSDGADDRKQRGLKR